MSYPRNAASPPTVTLGAIVQISDGAVQTSGASVRVKTGAGAWGAGAGTLACDTTSGVWTYLPTQGETDDTHFSVAAYKTSCVPVGVTVVTSASATAGYAGLDWSKVANPTTALGLSGTTVKAVTDAPADSAGVTTLLTRIVGTLATGTHSPQTGDAYALAANGTYGLAALKALIDVLAGYVDTEVAAIKAKTDNLPATPASTSDIPSASSVAAQVAAIDIDGKTLQAAFRIVCAAAAGLASGAGTSSETYKGLDQSTTRLVVVADASGNRTSVTYS